MTHGMSVSSSKDSVASVPPSADASKWYVHFVEPEPGVTKANSRPGSAATTSGLVLHRMNRRLLLPLNLAPTAGPVAPSIHPHLTVSGLHSPMRVTSETMS